MERQELIGKIHDIHGKIYDKVPFINNGGCARFALHAHVALNKLGIKNQMRVELGYNDNCSIMQKKKDIKNIDKLHELDKEGLAFNHTWIYIPSMDINFDGEIITTEGKYFNGNTHHGSYNEKQMNTIIMVGNWNKNYDVRHNKKLLQIVSKTLK